MSDERTHDEIEEELLTRIDSLYAEHGNDVTRADVEETIRDCFYEPE